MSTGKLVPLRRVAGDPAEMSDEALVAAAGTGDPVALGTLFDRYHVAVYRFASRLPAADELGRDDLVQATFLEIARAAPRFRGTSSVRTWILGIAANIARTQLRAARRRLARQARFIDAPVGPELLDEVVERRLLMQRIREAILELPPAHQMAFILCDLEQLPGLEVAEMLGIPEGTLWRHLHHARKTVRAAIESPGFAGARSAHDGARGDAIDKEKP